MFRRYAIVDEAEQKAAAKLLDEAWEVKPPLSPHAGVKLTNSVKAATEKVQ